MRGVVRDGELLFEAPYDLAVQGTMSYRGCGDEARMQVTVLDAEGYVLRHAPIVNLVWVHCKAITVGRVSTLQGVRSGR